MGRPKGEKALAVLITGDAEVQELLIENCPFVYFNLVQRCISVTSCFYVVYLSLKNAV